MKNKTKCGCICLCGEIIEADTTKKLFKLGDKHICKKMKNKNKEFEIRKGKLKLLIEKTDWTDFSKDELMEEYAEETQSTFPCHIE